MHVELREALQEWINFNRPPVCLEKDYFIICRTTGMMIVTAGSLRIGDIRLVTVTGSEFVKGLTGDQWTQLVSKITSLRNVVFVKSIEDIFVKERF